MFFFGDVTRFFVEELQHNPDSPVLKKILHQLSEIVMTKEQWAIDLVGTSFFENMSLSAEEDKKVCALLDPELLSLYKKSHS